MRYNVDKSFNFAHSTEISGINAREIRYIGEKHIDILRFQFILTTWIDTNFALTIIFCQPNYTIQWVFSMRVDTVFYIMQT